MNKKEDDICPHCGTILRNYLDILDERIHISDVNPDFLKMFGEDYDKI